MGKAGPPKTPLAILKKRGSQLVKEREENSLVIAEVMTPDRPEQFKYIPRALNAWKQLIPELEATGVLTKGDRSVLLRYCIMQGEIDEAQETIFKKYKGNKSYSIKNARGEVVAIKEFPETKVLRRYAPLMLQIENSFGMNPSARSEPRQALIKEMDALPDKPVVDVSQFFND